MEKFNWNEETIGYSLGCLGLMFALTLPFALSSIYGSALQGIMFNRVPDTEQGGLSALNNVTSTIGPLLLTSIFAIFTGSASLFYFPGMPFVFAALLGIIAGILVRKI